MTVLLILKKFIIVPHGEELIIILMNMLAKLRFSGKIGNCVKFVINNIANVSILGSLNRQ